MRKELLVIWFGLLLVLIVFTSGCIENEEKKKEKKTNDSLDDEGNETPYAHANYSYRIEYIPNTNSTYNLYVPAYYNRYHNTSVDNLNDNITIIEGNATLSIIETIHGYALNLIAMGTIKISLNEIYSPINPCPSFFSYDPILDMGYYNGTCIMDNGYWVNFLNLDNNSQSITLKINETHEQYYYWNGNKIHLYEGYFKGVQTLKEEWQPFLGEKYGASYGQGKGIGIGIKYG